MTREKHDSTDPMTPPTGVVDRSDDAASDPGETSAGDADEAA